VGVTSKQQRLRNQKDNGDKGRHEETSHERE
jgi:hypothetical protein